jgi:hypothetical protein
VCSADQVDSIIASLAAIIGVALGSVLTYLFQVRNAQQAQEFARDRQFWQERLAGYSEFAGMVTDLRRSEYDRWHREQDHPQGEPFIPPAMSPTICAARPRQRCAVFSLSVATAHSRSWPKGFWTPRLSPLRACGLVPAHTSGMSIDSYRDRVVAAIRVSLRPVDDGQLAARTGISPRQGGEPSMPGPGSAPG